MFLNLKALNIPEGSVIRIKTGNTILWEKVKPLVNWARCSINADGSIYNNGLGYKNGYRVRSGGTEAESNYAVCTGFIPLKKGETLRIYPPFTGRNNENAISFSDESFTTIGQITDSGSCYGVCTSAYKSSVIDGVSTLTVGDKHDSRIAYVRVTHYSLGTNKGEDIIITVNQEIA